MAGLGRKEVAADEAGLDSFITGRDKRRRKDEGERPAVVARELDVPEATARSWKHRLKNGNIATLKKGASGGIVGELLLEHLKVSLRTLAVQTEHLSNPERLREMRAGELGIFFGTLHDRTLRMMEVAAPYLPGRGRGVHS